MPATKRKRVLGLSRPRKKPVPKSRKPFQASTSGLAARVRALEKNIETKAKYSTVAGNFSAGTNLLYDLTPAMGQGDTVNDRAGNKVTCKSIFSKIMFELPNTATATTCRIRVIVVNSPSGQSLTGADVLQDASTAAKCMVSPYQAQNIEAAKHYTVMQDLSFELGNQGGLPMSKIVTFLKRYTAGKVVQYDGGSTLRGNNYRPQMLIFSYSSLTGGSVPIINNAWICKFAYTDS